jgi:hypothetical protein
MKARTDGAEDVAAVELCSGQEIQGGHKEADPGGAANRGKEQEVRIDAWMEEGVEEAEKERDAEDDGVLAGVGICDGGDNSGMEYAIDHSGNGKNKTGKRAGGADVKESARGANLRTDEDEGAEGADEVGEGNEKRVGGADVMVAAGEEMAEFVGEKNGQESGGEGEAGEKSGRIFVEESEGTEEFVERGGLMVGVSDGELCASGEAGAEREEKERDGEEEGFEGRAGENRDVELRARGKIAPIVGSWERLQCGI